MKKNIYDSPLMQMLSHVADLMILNILWILCSIPVFTAGASTTALYSVAMKLLKGEGAPVARTFFEDFRSNFGVATRTWLVLLIPSALIFGSAATVLLGLWEGSSVVGVICLVVAALFWLAGNFVYPLTAYFENTIRQTLCNALFMTFGDLPRAILVGALSLIPFGLYMLNPNFFMSTLIFWLIAGMGILADLQSRVLQKVFERYIPQEEENEGTSV